MKKFIKRLWHIIRLPEMLILPGNLAFFLILSLAPIISLFGMTASLFSLSTVSITNYFSNLFPKEIVDIILPFFDGVNVTNILFVIVGLYVASNASDSLITASNLLYKIKNKNYIYRRIKSLFMTFWLLILFVVTLIVLAFGSFILTKLSQFGILGEFIANNYLLILIIKTLIAFITIFLIIKIVYTLAPDQKIKSKYVNYGSLFATVSIIIVCTFYSFYVNNIAHYDIIYGSLANIAILMLLVYFISYIIVLGIAINHNYYEMNNKE